MAELTQAVEGGFLCHAAFLRDPWLKAVHADPRFDRLVSNARVTCLTSSDRSLLETDDSNAPSPAT
jgi:hypothetical protein